MRKARQVWMAPLAAVVLGGCSTELDPDTVAVEPLIDGMVEAVCAHEAACGVPTTSCSYDDEGSVHCKNDSEPGDFESCAEEYRIELMEDFEGCSVLDANVLDLVDVCLSADVGPCDEQSPYDEAEIDDACDAVLTLIEDCPER